MTLAQVYASRIAQEFADSLHGRKLVAADAAERIIDELTPKIEKLILEYHRDAELPPAKDTWKIREFGRSIQFTTGYEDLYGDGLIKPGGIIQLPDTKT